ncbi:hypothetical protein, partial [Akkermansia sp.]|uniref:hypothetical protein n=1 Tax=Akkermansia sp. TaxID=1872421 RepID=UPI003AB00F5E
EGHRQWGSIQPLLVPVPGLFAGSRAGFDASRTFAGKELPVGPDGTHGHTPFGSELLEEQQ